MEAIYESATLTKAKPAAGQTGGWLEDSTGRRSALPKGRPAEVELSTITDRRRPFGWRRGGRAPSACLPPAVEGGRGSAALAAGPMTAGLVGSERVRRHPHRRARSAPRCGVSRGPRAYRVRVPVPADPSFRPAMADRPAVRRRAPNPCYSAASAAGAAALGHTNLRRIPEGRRMVHHTNPTFSPRCWIRVGFSESTQSFQSLGKIKRRWGGFRA